MQKSILITGCSSGIGLAAALSLHQRGYRVFASARKAEDVAKLKGLGLNDSLILDVDDSNSIQQALNIVLEKTGGTLDALFNNAGYAIPGAVEDLNRDLIRKQFETNVFGAIELTNLVIPVMRKQGHGRIIQNTSILGTIAMPFRGAYNASKFALEGFSNTLRIELRGTGIYVSIIAPGPIESQFRSNAVKNYQTTLSHHESIHAKRYQKMESLFSAPPNPEEQKITLPPNAVVDQLIHALESSRPRAHYFTGTPAKVFALLRRILPECALDWVIDTVMRGEK